MCKCASIQYSVPVPISIGADTGNWKLTVYTLPHLHTKEGVSSSVKMCKCASLQYQCPIPIDAAILLHQEDRSADERERRLGGPAVAAEVEAVAVRLRFGADGRGWVAPPTL